MARTVDAIPDLCPNLFIAMPQHLLVLLHSEDCLPVRLSLNTVTLDLLIFSSAVIGIAIDDVRSDDEGGDEDDDEHEKDD